MAKVTTHVTTHIPLNLIDIDYLPIDRKSYELAKLIAAGTIISPIKLQRIAQGRFKLKNGRHKFVACKLLGYSHIAARFKKPTGKL